MSFLGGIPLLNDLFSLEQTFLDDDLDMRAFEFLGISYVDLAYLDNCHRIFYQHHAFFRNRSGACHLSVLVDRECCVCCDCIAIRCYCLTQCVLLVGLQAFNFVGFLAGCPLLNDLSVLIENLDLRAFELFAVSNVDLAYLDTRHRVFH